MLPLRKLYEARQYCLTDQIHVVSLKLSYVITFTDHNLKVNGPPWSSSQELTLKDWISHRCGSSLARGTCEIQVLH